MMVMFLIFHVIKLQILVIKVQRTTTVPTNRLCATFFCYCYSS